MRIRNADDSVATPPGAPIQERCVGGLPGLTMLSIGAVTLIAGILLLIVPRGRPGHFVAMVLVLLAIFALRGLITVQSGQARVILLFGEHWGTVRTAGVH